jgi:hypothetical protein
MHSIISEKIYKETKNRKGTKVLHKKPIGVFVAGVIGPEAAIGFSLCHRKDTFDKINGKKNPGLHKKIAITRASKTLLKGKQYEIPHSIREQYKKFTLRCGRYYKNKFIIT